MKFMYDKNVKISNPQRGIHVARVPEPVPMASLLCILILHDTVWMEIFEECTFVDFAVSLLSTTL